MTFDLNLLRNLAMLLHTRSVTLAAQKLGISQPAMSRALAELRQILGDPLLVRTRGGMLLTRRAEELIGPVQRWLEDAARIVSPPTIDLATLDRRFRIATSDFGLLAILRPAIPVALKAAPGIAFDIIPLRDDPSPALAAGEIDFAVSTHAPDRTLVYDRHLFDESYVCLTRPGHPLARRLRGDTPGLRELLNWPHVAISASEYAPDPFADALGTDGSRRSVTATTSSLAGAQMLLLETDMILALPASVGADPALSGDLSLFPAPTELGTIGYWLTWHTRARGDLATQWLIDLIAGQLGRVPHDASKASPAATENPVMPFLVAAE